MHLFIVSEKTLPVHLHYSFAGVMKRNDCSWQNVTVNAQSERSQASMYADICRVHKGDEILFYLERTSNDHSREGGRFLGIFEVDSAFPFYEENGTYLKDELDISLIYRLLIKPKVIYSSGISEWQTMDEMTDMKSIYDIPWTLIYRKMTAGRGCTPLLPHESKTIKKMLDLRNGGQKSSFKAIAFDQENLKLIEADQPNATYLNVPDTIDRIDDHLKNLMTNTDRRWELQLQAYLMQEIKRNAELTELLFPQVEITWIGNEIYAGAGMQSMDILIFSENELNSFIHLIELKSVQADASAASQLNRYIKWVKAHIPDVSNHQIIPTIIAPEINDSFNEEITIYLRGHGITQYRTIVVNNDLNFTQTICQI
ncbi:hypothetical protein [Aquimarina sp. 2201CG5-10]|uniref:hypothetical protein n=1 Tax=Aquimarina callyspongiae TaxID=3098150 RepID=UPI002AB36E8F|nr:hypothetical protein [Aquimarina sp. 2201CG5-10]MDY8138444.1 hypothetical protein [Aquimarina sp. 2201CG5-10]